jgi:hypothetical protein
MMEDEPELVRLYRRADGVYRERRLEVFAAVRSMFYAVSGVLLTVGCLSLAQQAPKYWYHLLVLGGGGVSVCAAGLLHEQEKGRRHNTLAHDLLTHYKKPATIPTQVPPVPTTLVAPTYVTPPPAPPEPYVPPAPSPRPRKVALDAARILGEQLRSTIVVGQSGAGKGRLVKHALLSVKRAHPEVTVWVVDPKQDEHESHQWESADRVSKTYLPPFPTAEEVETFQKETTQFIEEFKLVEGPKLIVLDEAMAVKEATGKWYRSLITGFNALCSMGRSRRQYGWVISQSPNAGDLGLSGGARDVYTRVLVIHTDDRGVLGNNSTFYKGAPTPDLWFTPSGRVVYLSTSDTWGALPSYE